MDKDAYIKKLERRIHNQRAQLRWWERLFQMHVHSVWRRAVVDRARSVREAALRRTQ